MIPYIINEDRISLFIIGKPVTLTKDDTRFEKIAKALRDRASDEEIQNLLENRVFVPEVEVTEEMSPALAKRVEYLRKENLPLTSINRFIHNLNQNPSEESKKDLYGFLEACDLPITEDGCFLAYKRVDETFHDLRTHSMDNSVGQTVCMPREQVDPDRNQTCSTGLHVCSKDYLKSFSGDNTVVVKVNPRDVVAVPVDYHNAKMRVCRYVVIGIIEPEKGEDIKPLAVTKSKKKKTTKLKKAKIKVAELDKAGKFDAYVKERKLSEDLTKLDKNQKNALRKFAARLLFGKTHAAGKEICACKTLSELKKVVCGE